MSSELLDTIGPDHPLTVTGPIANTDRAFGAGIAGAIAARFGDAGLPDGSVHMTMTGSAGQSFGAFSLPGMRLVLVGDANDGLGKGMHGGEIVVAPPARERGRARQVLAGNAALYGFIAGTGGERFAVRNSGATAVVEGAGDHACEYMTGGVAYVLDRKRELVRCVNPQLVAVDAMTAADRKALRDLLEAHERLTGSRVARAILRNDPSFSTFVRVAPVTRPTRVEAVAEVRAVNE